MEVGAMKVNLTACDERNGAEAVQGKRDKEGDEESPFKAKQQVETQGEALEEERERNEGEAEEEMRQKAVETLEEARKRNNLETEKKMKTSGPTPSPVKSRPSKKKKNRITYEGGTDYDDDDIVPIKPIKTKKGSNMSKDSSKEYHGNSSL